MKRRYKIRLWVCGVVAKVVFWWGPVKDWTRVHPDADE